MSKSQKTSVYGYYSHNHACIPGCIVRIYRKPNGQEILITGTGTTVDPEDSGYIYPQTLSIGIIKKTWQLLDTFQVNGPIDPEYLLDPENDLDLT